MSRLFILVSVMMFLFTLKPGTAPGQSTEPSRASTHQSAVVLMYHRFGESKYPSTNTTASQLDAQIKELTSGKYTVLPLEEIIWRLRAGPALPDRTVAITIDDAYKSIYDIAWPKFKAAGLPFTVFVSTDPVDQGVKSYMSWDEIKKLKENGVDIGNHSASHRHMAGADDSTNIRDIRRASNRLNAMLGFRPGLFAYPYGESSLALSKQIEAEGFMAAFGQQSGVIGSSSGFYYLPRFALNEKYGNIDRFRLIVNALPLRVKNISPKDTLITDDNPPEIRFTLDKNLSRLRANLLNCFLSGQRRAPIERTETADGANITIMPAAPFAKGRTRLNCTLPAKNNRWRWFGQQYYRP